MTKWSRLRCVSCGWGLGRDAREGGIVITHRRRAFLLRDGGELVVECPKCETQLTLRLQLLGSGRLDPIIVAL